MHDANEDTLPSPHQLLTEMDFPSRFSKTFSHPNDYEITNSPIAPIHYYYSHAGHNRFMSRLPIKLGVNTYTSALFIIDTGACSHFYFCTKLLKIMDTTRLLTDDAGNVFIKYLHGDVECKAGYNEIPSNPLANIIGAPLLAKVGMNLLAGPVLNDEHFAENAYTLGIDMI